MLEQDINVTTVTAGPTTLYVRPKKISALPVAVRPSLKKPCVCKFFIGS